MSGIFGVFDLHGRPVEQPQLEQMSRALAHRGPDGSAIWRAGPIALGHRALFTSRVDPFAPQPVYDSARDLTITADVRLDEREQLAEILGLSTHLRDGLGDAGLILAAYGRWGEACVERLRGDFSFALWDAPRQSLFCARDLFGVKSFEYHLGAQTFCFASESAGVLAHEAVPRELDEARIADFFVEGLEGIDHVCTFYRHVHRLPPAHSLQVTPRGITMTRYATLEVGEELRLADDREYVEAFRERLDIALRGHLRCHGPPAATLSGGLDSATLVAGARELFVRESRPPLAVFSAQSASKEDCRETRLANAVIAQGDLVPTRVVLQKLAEDGAGIERVYELLDNPFDGDMTLQIAVYRQAQARGHRVVLDGIEGDLLASLGGGYPAYLLRAGQPVRAQAEILALWLNTYRRELPIARMELQMLGAALPPTLHRLWRRARSAPRAEAALRHTILRPGFAHRVDLGARLQRLASHSSSGLAPNLREARRRQFLHPFLTVGLERYDRVAARCGVEPRHPLLERRLVQFCLALPWEQKVRWGWSKWIMRQAGQGRLPRALLWQRGREHLGGAFTARWMALCAAEIDLELKAPDIALESYIDLPKARRAWHNHQRGGSFDDQVDAWYAFLLSRWLRRQRA